VAFGWLSDRLIVGGHSPNVVRKSVVIFGHVGNAMALFGCASGSRTVVIACLLVAAFCGGALGPPLWSITQTQAGPRAAARWVGLQNAIANTAGVAGPVITGWIVDRTGSFEWAFLLTAAIGIIGAAGWGLILPRVEPLVWEEGSVGARPPPGDLTEPIIAAEVQPAT
jgi:MFS family permease